MAKRKKIGRALIRDHRSHMKPDNNSSSNLILVSKPSDILSRKQVSQQSVTEQSDLDEFLSTAELAGLSFTAASDSKIIDPKNFDVMSEADKSSLKITQNEHQQMLSIPRRPVWKGMTPEELEQKEREIFLEWRCQLAALQEVEHILLTPYEKNLECWRQLWRVIERSAIVVQIVDCRNPLLFWCKDLEKYVKEVGESKINVLLLNKADFLTHHQRECWSDYFNGLGIQTVFFSALEQNQDVSKEVKSTTDTTPQLDETVLDDKACTQPCTEEEEKCDTDNCTEEVECDLTISPQRHRKRFQNGTKLLSREELIEYLRQLHTNKAKDEVTTVGLVGYPNVGKSSTINALLRCKKVQVSATPGKTKHFQTLLLDPTFCLCDCPGMVFPNFVSTKAEMVINGILHADNMTDYLSPMSLISSLIPQNILESTYKIMLSHLDKTVQNDNVDRLLSAYGYSRGFMTKRGLPDAARSARYIIKDFVNGKLLYCHAPPTYEQQEYHQFPPPEENATQGKALQEEAFSCQLDKDFFQKINIQAHHKGKPKPGDCIVQSKKHGNRNKKEKLRRVYKDLDN